MIELEEVRRLRVEPGDALVVKMAHPVSREVHKRIRNQFEQTHPGVTILILEPGIDLEVLSA